MCFLFSSIPNTKTGQISIMVCAGMSFVANTPRPASSHQYDLAQSPRWDETHNFGSVSLDDQIRTPLKLDVFLTGCNTHTVK